MSRKVCWFTTSILLFFVTLGYIYHAELAGMLQNVRMMIEKQEPEAEEAEKEVQQEPSLEQEDLLYDPTKPMLALTFDDGPSMYTDELLDYLEEHQARATFFVLGSNVKKRPDSIKRMAEIGCEVGNHTYAHPDLTKLKAKEIRSQIDKTNREVKNVLGYEPELVRPTYGAVNDKVKKNAPYPLIFWSVDTTDWKKDDAKSVEKYVLKHAKDGEIILLHDIHKSTVRAMKTVIPKLQDKGFQLVTVSQMAEARGVTLEKQQKYFEFQK